MAEGGGRRAEAEYAKAPLRVETNTRPLRRDVTRHV